MRNVPPVGKEPGASWQMGDPDDGDIINAEFFNVVNAELCNLVMGAGLPLSGDDSDLTQVHKAVAKMIAAGGVKPGFDIPFSAGFNSDFTGADLAVQTYDRRILARAITIQGLVADNLGLSSTGAAIIFDILKNGVSVFTIKPQFAAGATVLTPGVLDSTKTACAAGDVLTFVILQVGSIIRGQKLTCTLKCQEA